MNIDLTRKEVDMLRYLITFAMEQHTPRCTICRMVGGDPFLHHELLCEVAKEHAALDRKLFSVLVRSTGE